MENVITVGSYVKCQNPVMPETLQVTGITDDNSQAYCISVSDKRKYIIQIKDLILA